MDKQEVVAIKRFLKEQNSKALTDPNSVQVMYRPVLSEEIPDIPNFDDNNFQYNLSWWTEQYRRCIHGWTAPDGVFINPLYYFYLNFGWAYIIDELKGVTEWSQPYYRDGDHEYFDAVYYNMQRKVGNITKNAKNLVVAKGRRKGWTTCELFGINMWFFLFKKEHNTNRSYPDEDILLKERDLFVESYNKIHPFFKYDEGNNELSIITNNAKVIGQGYKKASGVEVKLNKIFFTIVSKLGSKVRGDALILITVIEAGIHTKLKKLISAAEATLNLGTNTFGMILIGGTSDAINNESKDYKNAWYNPSAINAKSIFTPANKCFFGAINYFTGKSHLEYAKHLIMEIRKNKTSSGDVEGVRHSVQENPLSPEESFIPSGNSDYDEDKINNQLMHIMREGLDKEWLPGKLEWELDAQRKRTGKVIFEYNINGLWHVLDKVGIPKPNIQGAHIAGIDDVYKDIAPHSDSVNCMVVRRKETIYYEISDLPVAIYLGRHKSRMIDYEEFHKGTVYWSTMNMYEHNESGGFITYCRDNGFFDTLLYHNQEPGIRLSTPIKSDMTMLGHKMFRDDKHLTITYSPIMESYKYWGSEKNTDIGSAEHLALLGIEKTKNMGSEDKNVSEIYEPEYIRFGVEEYSENEEYFTFGL